MSLNWERMQWATPDWAPNPYSDPKAALLFGNMSPGRKKAALPPAGTSTKKLAEGMATA